MSITVVELQTKKYDLERAIRVSLASLIDDFQNATGYTPSYIDVRMVRENVVGVSEGHYILGEVSVGVEI